ncbi:Actin cytoskeleton-regulatory complex protein PAN1, partial [Candida tropicalis]
KLMYNPYQQQGMGYNPQQQQQPPPQQQQGGGFGYNSYQQPQYTQPQMFSQATGFIPQQPNLYGSNFQNPMGIATQPTGYMQPQPQQQQAQPQQQQQQQQQQQPMLQAQQTGYIQTQPTGFGGAAPVVTENSELKIPNMRLSFITAEDQKKFEHLFRTAVPKGEQSITGDAASSILLRSGLSAVTLAEIWTLSDIDKTGALLFPEFALSLHLCSMAKRGEPLPGLLPEKWRNEVQSFMDQINFSIPDDPSKVLANTPFASFAPQKDDWLAPQTTGFNSQGPPPMTSFQPQATGFGGLVSQQTGGMPMPTTSFGAPPLTAQRTGGGTLIPLQPQQTAGLIPAQKTGPLQQQRTGGLPQQTTGYNAQPVLQQQRTGGLPQQTTGYNAQPLQQQRTGGLVPQSTGYQQQMQSQATGGFVPTTSFQQPQLTAQRTGQMLQSQPTGPLQAQPTGRPGEWGFVSMPTGGIPGLNAMQQHFLPNTQLPTSNLHSAMDTSLKSNVTWAITKQEKQIYDGLFQAWDNQKRGYVDSTVALNVFTKSGLSRPDLESIWTLVDTDDTGKLNKNQFAVAMHLIYRRLNGYDIPLRLPPELVPPADRTLRDTMDSLKNSLKGGSTNKPVKPPKPQTKPDGTRFKNNDDSFGYVSNARHRRKSTDIHDTGSKSSLKTSSDSDLTIEDMKKLIHEKKILLDAIDTEDQANNYSRSSIGSQDQQVIENLKKQIMDTQSRIDEQGVGSASNEEKKQLSKTLDHLTRDIVPRLISDIHKVNQEIAKKKVELVKLQLQKENPSWNPEDDESQIVGTGPNGEVTDYDRIKFQSRKKLNQRMAALTGKSTGGNSELDFKLKDASEKAQAEANSQSEMIKDIGAGIKAIEDESASKLNVSVTQDAGSDKWEKGVGISAEVAKFVKDLQAFSEQQSRNIAQSKAAEQHKQEELAKQKADLTASHSNSSSPATRAAYTTPEERAAYIKEQAEKRMNERLAKLGITRRGKSASSESVPQVPRKPESAPAQKTEPAPVAEATPKAVEPTPQKVETPKPQPVETPAAVNNTTVEEEESSDDDDDEEYRAMLKQKQEMEAREKERKLRKQKAKEERLAKIKREMEEMKKREQQESDDDEEEEESVPVTTVPVYKPSSQESVSKSVEEPKKEESVAEQPKPAQSTHDNNPFAKMNNNSQQQQPSASTTGGNNPFFKPTTQETGIDPKKAAAQRASQRGISSSSGWSDSEDEESEDDTPNRAGAAQLASLLFGGMPQPPTRSDSNLDKQVETRAEELKQPVVVDESKNDSYVNIPSSSSTGDFETPEPASQYSSNEVAPAVSEQAQAVPDQAPPVPEQAPPVPEIAPPVPEQAPPVPEIAPPIPSSIPPPPPPPAPPVPGQESGYSDSVPPPAPPFPFPGQTGAAPPAPPPPPPPAPPAGGFNDSGASAAPSGGAPNISALLGQITGGKSLRKVETKVSSGATVGRVL